MIIGKDAKIQWLIERKFPYLNNIEATFNSGVFASGFVTDITEAEAKEIIESSKIYKKDLEAKTDSEIDELFAAEEKREEEKREASYFYNQPNAKADFDYWSKMEGWSIDEAVALSFGKEPKIVNLESLKRYKNFCFVKEYHKIMELVKRAVTFKKLYAHMIPLSFVSWAKENELQFPEELEKLVTKRKGKPIDWKKRYEVEEKLKNCFIALIERNRGKAEEKDLIIEELQKRISLLENEDETNNREKEKNNKYNLSTKEINTLFKLIAGMATAGYSYDKEADRNDATADIENDTGITQKTVRKWVNKAIENSSNFETE